MSRADVPGGQLSGALVIRSARRRRSASTSSGTERWPGAVGWPGTLLGPEGTAVRLPSEVRDDPPWMRRVLSRGRPYLENCTVDASINCSRQVDKGARWMPWHQEPMKDVGACDKPRGAGNQAVIRGFPNRETCRA